MRPVECTREQDVLDALACDSAVESWADDLRAHVSQCAICQDIVTVALPLLQEQRAVVEHAQPPSSGIVWWRAQMRARQEAARAATRPITVVQALGLASGAAVFVMLLMFAAPTFAAWFGGLSSFTSMFTLPQVNVPAFVSAPWFSLTIAGALALLLLGPLAVYFALGDE
jgi:hypothetical protein